MLDLQPLGATPLPVALNGQHGRNRAQGTRQIDADDDRSALAAFLVRHIASPATYANYRKEVERLLLWCLYERGRALSDLTHEDLVQYQRFLADPQPRERWVMAPGRRVGRKDPRWRPFLGPLSAASQRQSMTVINSLFAWLVQARYLDGNPLALRSHAHGAHRPGVTRFLPLEHWSEVKEAILAMPVDTATRLRRAARTRWVFSLLYLAGLRAAETTAILMGNFFERRGADGQTRWWLEVHGKGKKTRLVPVTDELLAELATYRRTCGLKPLPTPSEMRPAVLPLIGDEAPLSRAAIYELVKRTMLLTADRVAAKGPEFRAAADHIRRASTHWLRHTAGTHMSEKLDVKVVRDHLGHENLATTSLYVHTEEDARHDATTAVHRVDWAGTTK